MSVKTLLSQIGLEANEIDIYLALVNMGEGTAGKLSRKSGVPRTYAYKILDSLDEKGLVQSSEDKAIRRYSITDLDAPARYLERRQMDLYKAQQDSQSLNRQLENLSNPEAPTAGVEHLNNQRAYEDFWKLLHSTITREIWLINPPSWWGDMNHSTDVKKWEQYRQKQHIWEKRFSSTETEDEIKFTELLQLKNPPGNEASLFIIDQYQVQVTSWVPFRAIRIESQEMVDLQKSVIIRS